MKLKAAIRSKALGYTLLKDNRSADGQDRRHREVAYSDGMEDLMTILTKESTRIVTSIERGVLSEYEKGQIDGALWLVDAVKQSIGVEV